MTVSSFQDLCRTLLLIVFAESVVSSACPLDCQNGAACVANGGRLGQKSWICECPLGFMGRFCEQAVPEKQTQRRVVESVTCAGGLTCEVRESSSSSSCLFHCMEMTVILTMFMHSLFLEFFVSTFSHKRIWYID